MIGWLKSVLSGPTNDFGNRATWQATHVHRKGGEYRVLEHGILEADHSDVVIYDYRDGTIWVRSKVEFYDGRFKAIDTVAN